MHRILFIALLAVLVSSASAAAPGAQSGSATSQAHITGDTPLMEAVRTGDGRKVLALLKAGADVNARNAGGVTALMLAAASGQAELIERLLEAGARPDITDYQGKSAADRAAENDHIKLASRLKHLSKRVDKSKQVSGYDFADDAFVDVKHPAWFKESFLDLRDDLADALKAGKQGIMLFIGTRRCSYCKVFLDRVLGDTAIRQRVQSNYDVIGFEVFSDLEMFDVDGQAYRVNEFVTKMKATYTPTLIFYGKGNKRLLRIVGYYPPDKFTRVLDYLEGGLYLKEPLRDYLARTERPSPGGSAEMIVDRELFGQAPYILDRRAAKGQRPLLVVFERGSCDACERLHRMVFSHAAIRKLISQYEAVQLDISDSTARVITPAGERVTARQWYERLNLDYSPAMVFFDEAGHEVMRLDSETLRYRLEGILQLVLEKAYEKDAQLQRWRAAKAIEAMRSQNPEPEENTTR
jgi:thioredoxin-related protein